MADTGSRPDGRIAQGRRFLRSNWDARAEVDSDQKLGAPMPPVQKECGAADGGGGAEGANGGAPGSRPVDLAPPDAAALSPRSPLELIAARRSRRRFRPDPLSLEAISFLLYSVQGVRERHERRIYRTVPSAGCRHALETYLFAARVEGLPPGLYRYLPLSHRLCPVPCDQTIDSLERRLDEALFGQLWGCAALFVWTAVPYRMEWRHTVAAHKLIALDAGHACQNLYLACEAIGCGTCAIGAYEQDGLDSALGVDGSDELAVYAAPVGRV